MTRAACDLILRFSTFGLVWRSIKDLKRITEAQAKGQSFCSLSFDSDSTEVNSHNDKDEDNDDNNDEGDDFFSSSSSDACIEIHDWEILQLWALYAFHVLYIYSGLEWFVSFLPLYYYMKMIVLVITFLIPNTKFANFWFELLLVPMMQRVHELLNLDWKAIVYNEMMLLPWRILDLFLLPGLMSDEEAKRVMALRQYQLEKVVVNNKTSFPTKNDDYKKDLDNDRDTDNRCSTENNSKVVTFLSATVESGSNEEEEKKKKDKNDALDELDTKNTKDERIMQKNNQKTKNASNITAPHDDTEKSPQNILPTSLSPPPFTTTTATSKPSSSSSPPSSSLSTSFTSPIARSRVAVSSLHLQKFSRDHKVSKNATVTDSAATAIGTTIASRTRAKTQLLPPSPEQRRQKILVNQQTTVTNGPKHIVKRPPSVAFKQTKASILLSQSTSSSSSKNVKMKSNHVHLDSKNNNPSSNDIHENTDNMKSLRQSNNRSRSGPKPESSIFRRRPHHSSPKAKSNENGLWYDDDDDLISTSTTRKSMGNSIRKFITGDDNIRIRDFLFDLELPSMPSPMRRSDVDNADATSANVKGSGRSGGRGRRRRKSSSHDDDDNGTSRSNDKEKMNGTFSPKSKIAKGHVGATSERKNRMEERRRRQSLEEWKKERNARKAAGRSKI